MNTIAALIIATTILVMVPGPNVALIVANSLRYGFRMGVYTVFGTTSGVALQLLIVVAGMATLIEMAADALIWIRWLGVAYLIWLGVHTWREPAADLQNVEAAPAMFWRGLVLAVINPKILLFNAAFIPQFVADGSMQQFVMVSSVFLCVVLAGDLAWAAFASSARKILGHYARWRNRITGSALIAAGIGLALSRR